MTKVTSRRESVDMPRASLERVTLSEISTGPGRRPKARRLPASETADDSTDFADAITKLYPSLVRFAAICTPPEDDPLDLVQEAVANSLARMERSSIRSPNAYLRSTILNIARSRYRKKNRRLADPPTLAGNDFYPSEMALIATLSVVERAAVYLVDVEGLTFPEAASILECAIPTAKSRVIRGRRKLRKILETGDENDQRL